MPTNLYGPNDNFDLNSSHVLPALIRKFHDAKLSRSADVSVWGSGRPRREFLHVDDLASACVFLMENYDGEAAHQRRHRRRLEHPRAGGNDSRRRISAGADCVRCVEAGRPSAQAARCQPAARPRMDTEPFVTRGNRIDLPVVSRPSGRRARARRRPGAQQRPGLTWRVYQRGRYERREQRLHGNHESASGAVSHRNAENVADNDQHQHP